MRALSLAFIALASCLQAAEPLEINIWAEGAPGKMSPHSQSTEDFIRTKAGKSTITDIHEPTITIYRPEKPNGTSVIVAPGGGFVFLSAVHEGRQVCEWLNTIGVTGILLKYRTPTRDEQAPHEKPVADAAKAIAIVREKAKECKLNPDRIGLLGFSAGGNLLAHITCDRPAAPALPNFGIMIYGGGWVDSKEPTKLKDGFTVPADSPPMFLACAHDDGQNATAATVLYLEYKKRNLSAELHLFTKGGHGFGMRDNKHPINAWPQRCAEWMNAMGWLPTKEKLQSQIQAHEKALQEIQDRIKNWPWKCGNDLNLIKEMEDKIEGLKQKLAKAEQSGETRIAKIFQASLQAETQRIQAFKEQLVEEENAFTNVSPEKLVEEINAHKKAIAEAQYELELIDLKH